jgi:hypothetical protein
MKGVKLMKMSSVGFLDRADSRRPSPRDGTGAGER